MARKGGGRMEEPRGREMARRMGNGGRTRGRREGRGDGGDGEARATGARDRTSAHPHHHTPSIRIPTSRTPAVGNRPARADPRGGQGGPRRVHPRSGRNTKGDRGGGTSKTRTKGRAGRTRTRPTTGAPPIQQEHHGDTPLASYEHHGELDPQTEPDRNDTIGQLAYELGVPREAHLDWAEETDRVLGYTVQGEYLQTNYPAPAPSPPAPWYPPQPPTSDYPPPQTQYLPPHQRYSRQEAYYTPRRPRFHPHTRSPPTQRDRFENRTGHVTAVYR